MLLNRDGVTPSGTIQGFLEQLPDTIRENVYAQVAGMVCNRRFDLTEDRSEWLNAYMAEHEQSDRLGFYRSVMIAAALDHIFGRTPLPLGDRAKEFENAESLPLRKLALREPLRVRHWEASAAEWSGFRESVLSAESLFEFDATL